MSRPAARSPASLGAGARRAPPPSTAWSPNTIVNAVKRMASRDEREMLPLIETERASSFDERRRTDRPVMSPASLRKHLEIRQPKPKRKESGRFGLYAQYFAVGVVYGGLPQTMYGFFLGYLNVDAYAYAAATTVVAAA